MSEFFVYLRALLLLEQETAMAAIQRGIKESRIDEIPTALSNIDPQLSLLWLQWRESVDADWTATATHVFKKGHHYLRRY